VIQGKSKKAKVLFAFAFLLFSRLFLASKIFKKTNQLKTAVPV
jgi:hypothetical protein